MNPPLPNPRPDDGADPTARPSAPHELALQLASRFWALVRSGRAYSVGHVTYTSQLASYLTLLSSALEAHGVVTFDVADGELRVNGEHLYLRANTNKALESLAQEFAARTLMGLEFERGLSLPELETFMGFFLPGERWKGAELIAACDDAGLQHVRALPVQEAAEPLGAVDSEELPADIVRSTLATWRPVLAGARDLLEGGALNEGIELRHVKRLMQPLVDAVLAGERTIALLAEVTPRESTWHHAAHTALLAVSVGARLGLSRHDLSDVAVAALLHDAGHGWGDAGEAGTVSHTREGLRRVAWSTTLNSTSLGAMRVALEHHSPALGDPESLPTTLLSQLVSISDAYVTLLAHADSLEAWLSPNSALARVIGPMRGLWHPALPAALVRALGVHPPGQYVELDDGSLARAMGPDANDPERPWIEPVADSRGMTVPPADRRAMPLPAGLSVARALPRAEWPHHPFTRRAS
jgi:hypothetical protein